jgi:excisionase family DNA binding protein
MPRSKTRTKPSIRTTSATEIPPAAGDEQLHTRSQMWPEVLTLPEAAAYLRISEAEMRSVAGSQGLPGRRIGSEWRFSREAILEWLRRPNMKESLLQMAGAWKDDPEVDEMLKKIYRQRGRPMTEGGRSAHSERSERLTC